MSTEDFNNHNNEFPKIWNSLKELPNYIKEDLDYSFKDRQISFKITDYRYAHETETRIIGMGSKEISMYGYAILFSHENFFLEIWNDEELNCWSEYNLKTKSQIYIKYNEVKSYLSKYVSDNSIIEAYIKEIDKYYGTSAFKVCHYYFLSDEQKDRETLTRELKKELTQTEKLKRIRNIANHYFDKDDKQYTWRGLCILKLAHEIFFKDTDEGIQLGAEYMLLGNTAIGWGGRSQKFLIKTARKYLPFITLLYKKYSSNQDTKTWFLIMELFSSLLSRKIYGQESYKTKNFEKIITKSKNNELIQFFLKNLPNTKLLNENENKILNGFDS